jgi:hypothetical protein
MGIIGRQSFEAPVASEIEDKVRTVVYRDASGAVVADAAEAVSGEIVEEAEGTQRHRAWFRIQEVELDWLPIRESAFLLWILALLAAVWLAIGLVLHFT